MLQKLNSFFYLFLLMTYLSGCAGTLVGGAAVVGLASVQERSIKDAAIDMKLGLQLEEKLFRLNTEELFANVDVIIVEQRVLMIGNVESQKLRDLASKSAWEVSPKIKEVLNEITIGKKSTIVSEAKDARISLSLSGLLIGDSNISDINFNHSVSKQVIFLIGIAKDDEELNQVIHHARTVKGVKKVISHIILKSSKKRI
ncbi:MAG: BON domain-containing protein [Pelagibacterales bacterium]|jgi:osmotically-inducible protein OsmY|nr:BON domain-containing protein [Pelagibacterales bacterium]